jgi:hypothetical protein
MQSALGPVAPASRALRTLSARAAVALTLPALPWLVTTAFIALGIMTSLKTPLYLGADEGWHYAYVEHYALGRPLPNLNLHFTTGDVSAPYFQTHEAAQPPLYYMLMGRLAALVPRGNLMQEEVLSGDAPNGAYGNFLPADDGSLGSGLALAGHLVRFATVLLGAVVVICSYYIALWLTRRREVALLTIALVTFNPHNLVLSGAISNDMAVACTAALTLLVATYIMTTERQPGLLAAFLLGLFAGASLLTKYSGGALLVAAPVALLVRAVRSRYGLRWLMLNGAVLTAGALVLTGPFFIHNLQLYSDVLAWQRVNTLMPPDMASRPFTDLLNWLPYILTSFFAHPGYIFPLPSEYTRIFFFVLLIGLAGSLWLMLRRRLSASVLPLLVALGVNMVTYYFWFNQHRATESMRFFTPTLIPITLLVALGLLVFVPRRWQLGVVALGTFAYGSFTAVTLSQSFDFMYAFPHYLGAGAAQALLNRPDSGRVRFENGIELLDVQLKNTHVDDGSPVDLSITLRTTRPLTRSAFLMLDFRDPSGKTVASYNTRNVIRYSYATRAWQVGRPLVEDYQVTVETGKSEVLRILAGWNDDGGAIRPAGNASVSVEIGRVKVRAEGTTVTPAETAPPLARLDGLADLLSARMDGDTLILDWRATAQATRNYTIFVHGLDAQGNMATQKDRPFDYSAVYWDKGELFEQRIDVPNLSQARTVQVGVYDPDTLQRVRALNPDGGAWADASIVIK